MLHLLAYTALAAILLLLWRVERLWIDILRYRASLEQRLNQIQAAVSEARSDSARTDAARDAEQAALALPPPALKPNGDGRRRPVPAEPGRWPPKKITLRAPRRAQ